MKANLSTKPPAKGVLLNSTDEKIISMMYTFHFGGALDTAHYVFSPKSLTYARSRLSSLAAAKYLYRFRLPSPKTGGTEFIYTLGSRGRNFLAEDAGLPVDWLFRPGKVKHLSYGQVQHNLLLTRFCVAAHSFCSKQTDLRLVETRLCYELARESTTVDLVRGGTTEKLKVVPDAWLLFERLRNGAHNHFVPVLLEIDRGMEYREKFKHHVRGRVEFILSGAYSRMFGTKAVLVAYVTIGDSPKYAETRRKAMCTWTQEVLNDLHLENWSSNLIFTSLQFDNLYSIPIFSDPLWFRPDSSTPVPLFTP